MTPVLDPKKIAETNPAVDAAKLEYILQIQRLMESVGVQVKADYHLTPALQPGNKRTPSKVVRLSP